MKISEKIKLYITGYSRHADIQGDRSSTVKGKERTVIIE
jgi:hypothetical protein